MSIDKKEKFSIRKTTMGVGSLLLATTLFVSDVDRVLLSHVSGETSSVVQAAEVETEAYEINVVDFKQSETSNDRLWVEYNIKIKDGEALSGKKIELPAPYMKIEGIDEEFRSSSSLFSQRQDLYIDGQKIGYFRQVSGITIVELNDNISNYDNREINIGLEFVKKSATPQSFKPDLIGKDSSLDFTGDYNNPLKTDKSLPSKFKFNYYIDSKNGTKEIPVDFISHNPSYTESDYLKKMGLVDAKEFTDKYNPMGYFSRTSVDSRFMVNRSFHYAPDDDNVNKYTISVRNSVLVLNYI